MFLIIISMFLVDYVKYVKTYIYEIFNDLDLHEHFKLAIINYENVRSTSSMVMFGKGASLANEQRAWSWKRQAHKNWFMTKHMSRDMSEMTPDFDAQRDYGH